MLIQTTETTLTASTTMEDHGGCKGMLRDDGGYVHRILEWCGVQFQVSNKSLNKVLMYIFISRISTT